MILSGQFIKSIVVITAIFSFMLVNAQTVLISPTGDGGFENGATFAANGWTVDNGTVTNQWFVGNVPPGFTNNVAYVSNNNGVSWSYTATTTSVVHFYRDVTFPAGESNVNLSFNWQCLGETGSWDALLVSVAPTSFTPVGGNTSLGQGSLPAPAITLQQFWNMNSVQTANINIPASIIGNCDVSTTLRLIFTWKNDATGGTPPPAAIDNISLTSEGLASVMPLASQSPFTINNTLPTAGTNFNNFTDAVTWLNTVASGCPLPNSILFNVSSGQVFIDDVPELNASGTMSNTITFQKSGAGANPIIRKSSAGTIASSTTLGTNGDAIFTINGGDYITIDGIDLETGPGFTGVGLIEYGYYLKKLNGADACKHVTIRNCNITLDKAAIFSFGIYVSNISGTANVTVTDTGGRSEFIKIHNNNISNAYGGIQLRGFAAAAPYDLYDQNIEIGEDGGNMISNYGGGASIAYGIYTIYQNECKINNNTISGGDGTTGAHYAIFTTTSNNGNYQINSNNISMTNSGTTSLTVGIYNTVGTTSTTNTIEVDGNTITNISRPSATTGATYFIYSTANGPLLWKVTNNTLGSSTLPGTGIIYGIGQISTPEAALIEGNTISDITRLGTTSTNVFYGIHSTGSSTALSTTIANNEISGLTGNGTTGVLSGISLGTNLVSNVYNNKIYNLTSSNASGVVNGILIAAGSITGNVYNNLIGDLKAPLTGNSTAIAPSVRGINITSTTANSQLNVSFNTINLNATSTGANFGSAGIFHTGNATATTANLTLQNNIISNTTASAGTGRTVAFQRSLAALGNYNASSGNNLFYAGTPGASNLVYADGTNSDQTLPLFKCRVDPRESASVTENPSFLSTNGPDLTFLHINPAFPTQIESGGIPVAGITEDYDGNLRNANTPDIGADEGSFIPIDMVGPAISYTPLTNSICLDGQSLSASINDVSGVNTSSGLRPRIWFKKSTEANVLPPTNTSASDGWKWVEASNTVSPFQFTLNYNLLNTPISGGDIIQYFVVAQDLSAGTNVGTNNASYDNCLVPTSVALAANLFPVTNVNQFTLIALPSTLNSLVSPEELCVSGDVTLSINVADLGAEIQWQSSPAGANNWTNITGANTETYLAAGVTSSTDYRAIVSCNGVPVSSSPTTVAAVLVTNPQIISTMGASVCGPGPVSLPLQATASPGSDINWYANPTGGAVLFTGSPFNTPLLNNTTTYYVSASEGTSTYSAALPNQVAIPGTGYTLEAGLFFNAFTDLIIEGVYVYPIGTGVGDVVIALQNGDVAPAVTIQDLTVSLTGTAAPYVKTYVPLNFTVPAGTNYKLMMMSRSGAVASLVRESGSTWGSYPLTVPGVLSVVNGNCCSGNTTSTSYYYFYDWQIKVGCETPRVPVTATIQNDAPICPVDTTVCAGSAPFSLTGGIPAGGVYSGPGVTNGVFNPVSAGLGVHTITYANCNLTCTFTITVDGGPAIMISPVNPSVCLGSSITLTASGGVSYIWSTGENTPSITVSPAVNTNYSVTATSVSGCTSTQQTLVVVNNNPTASIMPAQVSICAGGTATLTASGGVSYIWETGAISNSIQVSPVIETQYTVTVTDSNGCTNSAVGQVSILTNPVFGTPTLTQPSNCASLDGGISYSLTGSSPYTFDWSTPNGAGLVQSQNQTTLSVGSYFVTVTDVNGCTATNGFSLVGPGNCATCPLISNLVASDTTICLVESISLTTSGLTDMGNTYGITFKYSSGAPLANPYSGGVNITTIPNAGLTSGGTEAGTTTSFPSSGSYYVYAILSPAPTDQNCRPFSQQFITVYPSPVVSTTVTENSGTNINDGIICNGASVNITASGGTSYLWSTGSAVASINVAPMATTTYTVTVTNINGCSAVSSRTITVNALPIATTTVTESSGTNLNDGIICAGATATITASGGSSYLWSTGAATAAINVTPAATTTYTVTVSTVNGCTATASRQITVNPLPVAMISVAETSGIAPNDAMICAGGSATLTATGGTSYLWSNGMNTAFINVTPATTTSYTVTVTNANGCQATASRNITVNPIPVVTITSAGGTICFGEQRVLTANPAGGTFILVSGPGTITGGVLTANGAGTIMIRYNFTDTNGCGNFATQSIIVSALPVITTQPVNGASCSGGNVSFNVAASITTGTVQYQWQVLTNGVWVDVPGATANSYTVNNVTIANNNTRYRVIVRNSLNNACAVISDTAILGVHISGPMACNNHVNFSLDELCEIDPFTDFFIEGPNSEMFYEVILRTSAGQIVAHNQVRNFVNQILTVTVRDICDGNMCWGTVVFEDKLPPVIECNCPGPEATTQFTGQLTLASPTLNRANSSTAGTCTQNTVGTNVRYATFPFTATTSGTHTFMVTGLTSATGTAGSYFYVYNAPFDPNNTCNNVLPIAPFFVSGTTGTATFNALNLIAGNQYVFVVTGATNPTDANQQTTNIFTININQSVNVIAEECYVECYNIDTFVAESNPLTASKRPVYSDACGPVSAVFTTHIFNADECSTENYILRKWLVTDASGNTAFCEQYFPIRNIGLGNVIGPDDLVELSCNDGILPAEVEAKAGITAAYPYYLKNGVPTSAKGVCKIQCAYVDLELEACNPNCHGNKKVIRTWTCLDWCKVETRTYTQIVKAVDTEAPTAILKDTTVSTRPWDCTADFFVPNPWELHDNCDINPTWTVKGPVGVTIVPAVQVVNGTPQPHPLYKFRAVGAPKGDHVFKYSLVDCCGNERIITNTITVVDKTPPVPVVKRDIVIGLAPGFDANGVQDGQAKLYPESIDNGSHDNCSGVRLEIRRPLGSACGNEGLVVNPQTGLKHNNNRTFSDRVNLPNYSPNDTDDGQFVKFCCEDLDAIVVDANGDGEINELDRGFHEVILRVWDDGNMNGIIGDAGDNWNESWAFVKVEAKVPPVITCPEDAFIHCDWAIETRTVSTSVAGIDFTKTGLPSAYGVCSNPTITFQDQLQLNQCGIGIINRTFTIVEGGTTRQCVQRITVLPSLSEQEWIVTPPSASVPEVSCTGPTEAQINANRPTWVNGPCDVIGVSHKIWEFEFEDGVCKKWVVEYKLVNWCDNEERGPYTKMFVYKDVVPPTFENCRDTMFEVDQNCELRGLTLTKRASDTGGCIDNGWIKWVVIVDLWADGTPDYEWSSFLPVGNDVNNAQTGNFAAIQDNNGNGIKDIYVAPTANGGVVSITIPEPIVGKMSNHKVTWKATDGCHNYVTCHEDFMVADKKPPTPVCVPLSTALMADPDGDGPADQW
ncbi:MAG: hypothetical protein IPM42_01305 [Saprospiraceae bacterium]|nr:hypothetical protein [Saprospiraceae bacterium]